MKSRVSMGCGQAIHDKLTNTTGLFSLFDGQLSLACSRCLSSFQLTPCFQHRIFLAVGIHSRQRMVWMLSWPKKNWTSRKRKGMLLRVNEGFFFRGVIAHVFRVFATNSTSHSSMMPSSNDGLHRNHDHQHDLGHDHDDLSQSATLESI